MICLKEFENHWLSLLQGGFKQDDSLTSRTKGFHVIEGQKCMAWAMMTVLDGGSVK